jgi:predicted DNA-binding protein (MmcQ/YjbR family)
VNNERIREICMAMPHVCETVNWGHHLVYWAGDRDIGGRMFASIDLDGSGVGVLSFHCGPERFHELLEVEGIRPTPYSAKQFWVTLERWDALRPRQIEDELKSAYELIFARLSPRTKKILLLPEKERVKVIRERKKALKTKGRGR